MQPIKKLHSKSGSSMILALVVLLVVATVSGLILGAAYVSAGKIKRSQESQQQYLAVSSAAEMLRNGFYGDSVVKANNKWSYSESGKTNPLSSKALALINGGESATFTITTSDNKCPAVNGEISWDGSNFVIYLYVPDDGDELYPLTIIIPTQVSSTSISVSGGEITIVQGGGS